eukprot:scaffold1923_cov160-Amphora_coffeaeformis.AAC.10
MTTSDPPVCTAAIGLPWFLPRRKFCTTFQSRTRANVVSAYSRSKQSGPAVHGATFLEEENRTGGTKNEGLLATACYVLDEESSASGKNYIARIALDDSDFASAVANQKLISRNVEVLYFRQVIDASILNANVDLVLHVDRSDGDGHNGVGARHSGVLKFKSWCAFGGSLEPLASGRLGGCCARGERRLKRCCGARGKGRSFALHSSKCSRNTC